jgi:5-methylcytosine-specific restriction endonuclease McrBC GTP-binding regulatory subunit McrB
VEFVTFHQSFSYEDLVGGLKAKSEDGKLSYEVEDGIFKKICKDAVNSGNDSLKQLNKMIKALKEQVAKEPLELITVTYKKKLPLILQCF